MKPDILVWAKDDAGSRHLCPMDILDDPNMVKADMVDKCVDHDERLKTRRHVPSNDPEGKIKFAESKSLN